MRDTILIEREYEGERCGMGGGFCPLMYRKNEDEVCPLTEADGGLVWSADLDGFRRCPTCLSTPAATVLLNEGADLAAVSALLGHSNVATTQKHYYQLMKGEKARAVSLLPSVAAAPKLGKVIKLK